MGLYIRSQGRDTILEINAFWSCISNGTSDIRGSRVSSPDDDGWTLGLYSTEEKALKVLDMIQEHINESDCLGYATERLTLSAFYTQSVQVFQMPQESEVE